MSSESAIEKLLGHLRCSLSENTFVSLRLSGPTSPESSIQSADVRLIDLKGAPHLSFTFQETPSGAGLPPGGLREEAAPAPVAQVDVRPKLKNKPTRVATKNLTVEDGINAISKRIGVDFRSALLRTLQRDWQLHCPLKGQPRLANHKAAASAPPARQHDLPKRSLLGPTANDWLHALGVTHTNGRPRISMVDKHRQISRYTEILNHLSRDCGWAANSHDAPMLNIADMGCGKGYLTFAAWHLFHRILQRPVSVLGIEARTQLVDDANQVARQAHAEGLEFLTGDIASVRLPKVDALIALHACNTATDDALRRGIELGSKLIVVAPCCHQALRPELGDPEPLKSLLRHGLFKERMAEWLTDGLRTLFLEWAGYQTKAIEFVASEHTPKNLMIAAIRKHEPFKDAAAKNRIIELKQFFRIKQHALDGLLK